MPTSHIELANAKLTRSLRITGQRDDGYHLIESEMVTLSFADTVEISDGDNLSVIERIDWSGATPAGTTTIPTGPDNLVARALRIVGRTANVALTKKIPAGAGLGGGSADAAAIFRWAGMDDPVVAARLGADIAFCLRGGHAMVTGIGEEISPLPFEDAHFILLTPEIPVETALVYKAFDQLPTRPSRSGYVNDLEDAALAVEPRLAWWRDALAGVTNKTPMLAGSGSTWFVDASPDDAPLAAALRQLASTATERACVTFCRTVATSTDL